MQKIIAYQGVQGAYSEQACKNSYEEHGAVACCNTFHIDIEGHTDSKDVRLALEELAFFVDEVRILGTYENHKYSKLGN